MFARSVSFFVGVVGGIRGIGLANWSAMSLLAIPEWLLIHLKFVWICLFLMKLKSQDISRAHEVLTLFRAVDGGFRIQDVIFLTALRLSEMMSNLDFAGVAVTARMNPQSSALNELAGPSGSVQLREMLKSGV